MLLCLLILSAQSWGLAQNKCGYWMGTVASQSTGILPVLGHTGVTLDLSGSKGQRLIFLLLLVQQSSGVSAHQLLRLRPIEMLGHLNRRNQGPHLGGKAESQL